MEDNFQLKKCSENDVLEFNSIAYRVETIIKRLHSSQSQLAEQIYNLLKSCGVDIHPDPHHKRGYTPNYNNWFNQGINCQLLKVGAKDWQKGKVKLKVTFEFIPDEPEEKISESPLDDIRQTTNSNNE